MLAAPGNGMAIPEAAFRKLQNEWVVLAGRWSKFGALPTGVREKMQKELSSLAAQTVKLYADIWQTAQQVTMAGDADKYEWLCRAQRTLYNFLTTQLPVKAFRTLLPDERNYRIWSQQVQAFVLKNAA
jgi:hypothetical protein